VRRRAHTSPSYSLHGGGRFPRARLGGLGGFRVAEAFNTPPRDTACMRRWELNIVVGAAQAHCSRWRASRAPWFGGSGPLCFF